MKKKIIITVCTAVTLAMVTTAFAAQKTQGEFMQIDLTPAITVPATIINPPENFDGVSLTMDEDGGVLVDCVEATLINDSEEILTDEDGNAVYGVAQPAEFITNQEKIVTYEIVK